MYFAVVKLIFEPSHEAPAGRRELNALVESIRARFRVCVMAAGGEDSGDTSLVVASLGISEAALIKQLDALSEFCEKSGFGRIADEKTLLDHIDSFGDELDD